MENIDNMIVAIGKHKVINNERTCIKTPNALCKTRKETKRIIKTKQNVIPINYV